MEPSASYIPQLAHPNQQDLARFSMERLTWKRGEIIGVLACQTPCSDFVFKVLIPHAIATSSTIKILYTNDAFYFCENQRLQQLIYATPTPTAFHKIVFQKISLVECDTLTFPDELKLDKLFCINDLHFFDDLNNFFQNLADNFMKPKGQIGIVVHFSKFMGIPRELFSLRQWYRYDKKPSGELLPGYRTPIWACNSFHYHIDTAVLEPASSRFNILHAFIQDNNWRFRSFLEIFVNVMIPSYADSFNRVYEDGQFENAFDAITRMTRALLDSFRTPWLVADATIQIPCAYLTFIAEKK